jgi:peptidoglycan/LPS O-acetylase OafA/YrhL
MRHEHVVGIDILRFFAACLVVAFHLGFFYLLEPGAYPLAMLHVSGITQYTSQITRYGFVGVEIFFVISGYVISFSIDGRDRPQYLRSRFLRLWPTVWVCATICLLLAALTHQGTNYTLVSHWAKSMAIFPKGPWIDGAYWTLPIEIGFYALLLVVGNDVNRRKIVAFALGAASIGFWACYQLVHSISQLHRLTHIMDHVANDRVLDILFLHYGIYFSLGMLLHARVKKAVMLPFCFFIVCAALVEINSESVRLSEVVKMSLSPWFAYTIWLSCIAYLVAAVRYNSAIVLALGNRGVRIFKGVGALTYPLYLVHVIVAYATAYALVKFGTPLVVAWSIGPVASILAATAIAHWMEPMARAYASTALTYTSGWVLDVENAILDADAEPRL